MKKTTLNLLGLILISFFVISFCYSLRAQSLNEDLYQYLSPKPGASLVMPSSKIIVRYGESFSSLTPRNFSDISVTGKKSGFHKGKLILLEKNKILSFIPSSPFQYGETVMVELKNKFRLINGGFSPHLKYTFRITEKKIIDKSDPLSRIISYTDTKRVNKIFSDKPQNLNRDSLPIDFPHYTVNYFSPSKGYIFFSPFGWHTQAYLIISDNYGIPIFYRKMLATVFDFQKQVSGNLTYFDSFSGTYCEMNNYYQVIDTLKMQNGYNADVHDIRILENGHSLMFAYDPQPVGMDTVVSGGNPNAIVTGLVLQELDENKNLIFQWRSWDHYKITDATYDINLTDSLIDYVHGNAIEIDYDGNILLSCRHMDEITKINRITGDIIWRWGGIYCKNNQFTFLNDSIGFSHQHCIRRLPNGNYTIFDNGNLHNPQFSRAVEYQMDETNKIVDLVWENTNSPVSFSSAMGSVERLDNHNTFIGWGSSNATDMTEVGPDGTLKLSVSLSDTVFAYRAFKYNWDTNLFSSDKDSLLFGIVPVGETGTVPFNLTNNNSETIEINSVYSRDSAFVLEQQLPITIAPQNSVALSVRFSPGEEGAYGSELHLRWESADQRIAKVIYLSGYTDSVFLSTQDIPPVKGFFISQNYPNPFNPVSRIKYSIPITSVVHLKVFDILGNEIATLVNKEQPAGTYEIEFNGTYLASGIYFYRFNAGEFTSVKKMLLLK